MDGRHYIAGPRNEADAEIRPRGPAGMGRARRPAGEAADGHGAEPVAALMLIGGDCAPCGR